MLSLWCNWRIMPLKLMLCNSHTYPRHQSSFVWVIRQKQELFLIHLELRCSSSFQPFIRDVFSSLNNGSKKCSCNSSSFKSFLCYAMPLAGTHPKTFHDIMNGVICYCDMLWLLFLTVEVTDLILSQWGKVPLMKRTECTLYS